MTSQHTYVRTDVTFPSGGIACAAWLYRPDGVTNPPVVVMAHGFAAFRELRLDAYAERFVRSIKEECLNRLIPLGERHHRRAVAEFVAHYHRERNHQGLGNELIEGEPANGRVGRMRRHQRLGGLLNYYARAA